MFVMLEWIDLSLILGIYNGVSTHQFAELIYITALWIGTAGSIIFGLIMGTSAILRGEYIIGIGIYFLSIVICLLFVLLGPVSIL